MKHQNIKTSLTIFTIGHSTRPVEEFIELLKAHGIGVVADVRTIPKSRHNPQYTSDVLAATLHRHGSGYKHTPGPEGHTDAKKH